MNHPDWPAFVAAVVAEPDDDTPRLVAADFLEENGDPDRAAFVRVQVALARVEASGQGNSLEADELRKRERAFLGPFSYHPHLWAAEDCPELVSLTPPVAGHSPKASVRAEGVERLQWRRGFVESVRCPAAEWLRHGAAVRRRNPVRWVALDQCPALDRDAWYAGLPALRGLAIVVLVEVRQDLAEWLKRWLPETEILTPFSRAPV